MNEFKKVLLAQSHNHIIYTVIFLQGFEDIIPLNRLMIFDEREVEVNHSIYYSRGNVILVQCVIVPYEWTG